MGAALTAVLPRWRLGKDCDEAEVSLSTLPNEVLLLVLEYLTPQELLLVRAVCRHWRDLALSEPLWRRQEIVLGMGRHFTPCWRLILASAPCVRKVWLSGRWAAHLIDVDGMQCALHTLDLRDLEELGSEHIRKLAELVAKQAAIGGLRGLRLDLSPRDSAEDFTPLYEAIGQCAIEKMTVRMWDDGLPRCSPQSWVPRRQNTIRKLKYSGGALWPNPWLQSLLQHHAGSLERLLLFNPSPEFPCSLLASCANLRVLECPLLLDMDRLQQCARLEKLHLDIRVKGENFSALVRSAASLCRAAAGLRELSFYVHTETDAKPVVETAVRAVKDIVDGAASSGRAALTSLTVTTGRDCLGGAWIGAVLRALSGLPCLENLVLNTSDLPPARVLREISATSAPALRSLRLLWFLEKHEEHMTEVRALLARHPALHVTGLMLAGRDRGGVWDELARELLLPLDCRLNLYAHRQDEHCSLHAVTTLSDSWFHIATT